MMQQLALRAGLSYAIDDIVVIECAIRVFASVLRIVAGKGLGQ
jgi:hypothetical protein